MSDAGYADRLIHNLPDRVRAALGEDGCKAVEKAAESAFDKNWKAAEHKLDARYNMPWFGGRAYVRVIAGKESRPSTRTKKENKASVGRTILNMFLIGALACAFYTVVGIVLLVASAVLE